MEDPTEGSVDPVEYVERVLGASQIYEGGEFEGCPCPGCALGDPDCPCEGCSTERDEEAAQVFELCARIVRCCIEASETRKLTPEVRPLMEMAVRSRDDAEQIIAALARLVSDLAIDASNGDIDAALRDVYSRLGL